MSTIVRSTGSGAGGSGGAAAIGQVAVRAKGATGAGAVDDTAAFHVARDAAGAGGIVIVEAGTYKVGMVVANVAGQTWRLLPGASLVTTNSVGRAFQVDADDVTVTGPGVIDGQSLGNIAASVLRVNGNRCRISEVGFKNSPGYAVDCYNKSGLQIERCRFDTLQNGAVFVEANSTNISNLRFVDNVVDTTAATVSTFENGTTAGVLGGGITFKSASSSFQVSGVVVTGNILRTPPASTASLADASGALGLSRCTGGVVANNVCTGGSISISIPNCKDVAVNNNYCSDFKLYAVEFPGSTNCGASGNIIDGNAQGLTGVACHNGSARVVVANNAIRNLRSTTSGTAAVCVNVQNTSQDIDITGNMMTMAGSSARAVVLNGRPGVTIANNTVRGDGTQPLAFDIIGASDLNVFGNDVSGTTTCGLQTFGTMDSVRVVGNRAKGVPFVNHGGTYGTDVRFYANDPARLAIALASNGAVTINSARAETATVTLGANATSATITGSPIVGQRLTIEWVQDATGGRTYTWPTTCKFAGGTAPTPSATALWCDSVTFVYDGTNWRESARSIGVR